MKRTPLDKIVSDLVRERAHWTCQRCQFVDIDGQARGKSSQLDCSHIQSRNNYSVRWDIDNCICLCKSCHRFVEDRPLDHADFARRLLGAGCYDDLVRKTNTPRKFSPAEKAEAKVHYKKEFLRLRELRDQGVLGYIECVNYE